MKAYNKQGNEIVEGIVASILSMESNGALHHGVLTHQDNGVATQTLPYILELFGTHIIGGHDQYLGVVI